MELVQLSLTTAAMTTTATATATRGIGKRGGKWEGRARGHVNSPPPKKKYSHAEKMGVLVNTLLQLLLAYVFCFWGFAPRLPPKFFPWTLWGTSVPNSPVLSPSETNSSYAPDCYGYYYCYCNCYYYTYRAGDWDQLWPVVL